MANYYHNGKSFAQEISLPVSGTLILKSGYYVTGVYFAALAKSGILVDDGPSIPEAVTKNPGLLAYTQPVDVEAVVVPVPNVVNNPNNLYPSNLSDAELNNITLPHAPELTGEELMKAHEAGVAAKKAKDEAEAKELEDTQKAEATPNKNKK